MDIHEIRRQLRTQDIYEIPMSVTFYARVSTDKDAQLNSLDNQVAYYEDFIGSNAQWTLVDGYIDKGLSAMTTAKRENFNLMIEDAHAGLFDLIITKEISRFARNTPDSIQYTRELLSCGVGVFFRNDNTSSPDEDAVRHFYFNIPLIKTKELRKIANANEARQYSRCAETAVPRRVLYYNILILRI